MPQNHQVAQKTKNQLASNLNPAAGGAAEQARGAGLLDNGSDTGS